MAYARTRNALDGAVSGLSPYITHGFVTLTDVLASVAANHALDMQHKFVLELGWRAWFRHVWQHRGAGILSSLHQGPLPDDAYARELPADIRQGCTGVPVIDQAVRALYATGMLHNHARVWLARWSMCDAAPALFPQVDRLCDSFSQWWTRATKRLGSVAELPAVG